MEVPIQEMPATLIRYYQYKSTCVRYDREFTTINNL